MILLNEQFSLWADYIEDSFIEGQLTQWVSQGIVNGATSNPAIFKQAFSSPSYHERKHSYHHLKAKELYEELASSDIQKACDLFLPLYKKGDDGFVSWEVDPLLCDDAQGTIHEARRLWKKVARPNLMIKIPATSAGYEAMSILSQEGMNINATLVFSPEQTKKCVEALSGNEAIKAVISVFVSRFDRVVDDKLPQELQAKLGIMNAAACYNIIEQAGYSHIKTLFASTGVKGDVLNASYYIDSLIGHRVVNTAPVDTIKAWEKSGKKELKLPIRKESINLFMGEVAQYGIVMETVNEQLLNDGLEQFKVAFHDILVSLQG